MNLDLSDYDWHPWPVIAERVTYYDADDLQRRRWAFSEVVQRKWDGQRQWPLTRWNYRDTKTLRWHTLCFRVALVAAVNTFQSMALAWACILGVRAIRDDFYDFRAASNAWQKIDRGIEILLGSVGASVLVSMFWERMS